MSEFAKNKFVLETIQKCGETAGLPLFESVSPTMSEKRLRRFSAAAKSIPIANSTKKLSRAKQKINNAQLSETQQIVFNAFCELGPSTNKEISVYLKNKFNNPNAWDASTVNARNYELRQFNKLKKSGKRTCKITGEIVAVWEVTNYNNTA